MSTIEQPPEPPDAEPGPIPARRPPSARTWIAAGVGAVALTAAAIVGIGAASSSDDVSAATGAAAASSGSTGSAGAQSGTDPASGPGGMGMPGGRGTAGTIASIDGSTLTVTDQQGGEATTVSTSGDTTVTLSDDAMVADVEVGDHVVVSGEGDATAITASRIVDSRGVEASDAGPGGGGPGGMGAPPDGATPPAGAPGAPDGMARASGTVASIDGDTMVVTTADGTVTVTTNADTTVSIQRQATVADLAVGDTVMVIGETTDGTVAATAIREGALGFGGPRNP